jgi:DNA-binding IclR family transcriptional regulator
MQLNLRCVFHIMDKQVVASASMSKQATQQPDGAQSIRRALNVLRILASARQAGLGLSEIARQANLTRPTTHRILSTLVSEGVVEQKMRTRRYAVGEQVPLLALARPAASPLLTAALPHLSAVVQALGDTGFLTLRAGPDTVCLARRFGTYPIQVLALEVGDRRPLGVSSAGFAMLARLPQQEARSIVMENRRRFHSYHVSAEEALESIAEARRAGFALRDRGLVPGTRAVSVTINSGHDAVAALTIAAIARRLPQARVAAVVARLREHADQIEAALEAPRTGRSRR